MKSLLTAAVLLSSVALAQPAPPPVPPAPPNAPMPPMPPPPSMHGGGPGFFHGPPGIPPPVAAKLGISAETVTKVQQLGFDANEQLINLEADLKRAQLELDRALAQPNPDELATLAKLDAVSRAELAVRKNRMSLMLRIRKALGPAMWDRLQAELPMMGDLSGPGGRREVRIIKKRDGIVEENVQVH